MTYKKLPDGIVAIYKNKNSYPVKLTGVMRFKDFEKNNISVVKEYNYCLGAKSTCIIFYSAPYDNHGNYINYASYKGSFSVAKTKYKSYNKKLIVSSDIQTIFTNFSAINTTGKKLENIHISILFYDGNGELLGCKGRYLGYYKKSSTELFTIDHNMNWGTPAKVKIYVDWAY